MESETITHYSMPTQILHWLTAILVLVAFIYGPGGPEQHIYAAARDADRQLHETLGICVLVLAVIRLLWRVVDKRPEPQPVARWMHITADVVQVSMFVLLFAVPLTAIVGAWLEGHAVTLIGGVAFQSPIGKSHAIGATIAEIHGWLGDVIIWLAGAHAAAALFHHHYLKDNVLRAMLPHRAGKSG